MKRKTTVVANWKMNLNHDEAIKLANHIKDSLVSLSTAEIVICPSYLYLLEIEKIFKDTVVKIGAQNAYWETKGAFTGEVSVSQLKGIVDFIICGHSERRELFGDTNEQVNEKVKSILEAGVLPIICVGESVEAWRKGEIDTVLEQVESSMSGISPEEAEKVIFAYEPVWAIGTANPASAGYANKICMQIRLMLDSLYSRDTAKKIRILYGGSVTNDNANKFVAESEIDGLLIGGASLKAEEFIEICKNVSRIKT